MLEFQLPGTWRSLLLRLIQGLQGLLPFQPWGIFNSPSDAQYGCRIEAAVCARSLLLCAPSWAGTSLPRPANLHRLSCMLGEKGSPTLYLHWEGSCNAVNLMQSNSSKGAGIRNHRHRLGCCCMLQTLPKEIPHLQRHRVLRAGISIPLILKVVG
jgi:hypothetical protein